MTNNISKSLSCGQISNNHLNQKITLKGYIKQIRILKNLVFIDLYDQDGITQAFFKKTTFQNAFYLLDKQKLNFLDLVTKNTDEVFTCLKTLSLEIPIAIIGLVKRRLTPNSNLGNGDIEIEVFELQFFQLNHFLNFLSNKQVSENTPFLPSNLKAVFEQNKLKYRYFQLRNQFFQDLLKKRSQYNQFIRNYFLDKENFIEVETPILTSPTVEGARSFPVPSFSILNSFFALPQSPQIYKQMLIISGVKRYFQIARCFRAEDLRENRQLEFTQLDLEIAFLESKHQIINLIDQFLFDFLKRFFPDKFQNLRYDLKAPNIIDYFDAMINYGTDKPDFRFMDKSLIHTFFFPFLEDDKDLITDKSLKTKEYFVLNQPNFNFIFVLGNYFFSQIHKLKEFKKNKINTLSWFTINEKLSENKKLLDYLILTVKQNKEPNLYYFETNRFEKVINLFNKTSKIASFDYYQFNENLFKDILFLENINDQEINNLTLLFAINSSLENNFFEHLGFLRSGYLAEFEKNDHNLKSSINWGWVINWPTFEYDPATKSIVFLHHPFTQFFLPPLENIDSDNFLKELKKIISFDKKRNYFSNIFDIVMNGVEIGGGSLRCHDQLLQKEIFKKLENNSLVTKDALKKSFDFFLKALNWAPPHGGIAIGLDRFYALVNNLNSIRDIIAFPKTSKGTDLLFNNPLKLDENILKEWNLNTTNEKND